MFINRGDKNFESFVNYSMNRVPEMTVSKVTKLWESFIINNPNKITEAGMFKFIDYNKKNK